MRVEALWRTFEQDGLPQLREHAERIDALLAEAERAGLRFPYNVLCSGPSVMSRCGVEEWADLVGKALGR